MSSKYRQITVKPNQAVSLHLKELDIHAPHLREMILQICVRADGTIFIGTERTHTSISPEVIAENGYVIIKPVFWTDPTGENQ